ncbi:hypothetical protein J3R82DRAFT_9115 [Butyriboletus roseoflavus]|nr:hypothetical protein J3R82DRAFT_9115 [Butyriboletus roseoflavus]
MPFLSSSTRLPHDVDPKIPSSISQLFCTNSVPSPMDTQRIYQLLHDRKAELSAFAEEIECARVQVQRLEQRRDRVKGVVQELEALVSPVRRMPTDIMAKVFEHCVWDQASPRADPRMAPLLLSQVCRSWRYLLFSLPSLWTTLQVDLPPGTKDWEALVQSKSLSMHVWLSRSKALPISLFLNHAKGFPGRKLEHLSLEYDASSFWNPVHSDYLETLSRCPNLTTLCLGIGAPINDVDPGHIVPVTLPHVHTFKSSIYVQTPYLHHFFDALRMPQLRHFDIKNVSLALGSFTGQIECLPLLARCADTLESVCFNRVDIADPAMVSCLAQLHRLKTLTFLPGILRLNHGLIIALAHGEGEPRICPGLEVLQMRCSSVVPVDAITRLVASRCETAPKLKRFSLQLATFEYGLDTRDDKIEQVHAQLRAHVEGGLQLVLTKSSSSG